MRFKKIKISPKAPIIFLPSDHYIGDKKSYLNLLKNAIKETGNHIGTIGITQTKPETGYGYIEIGEKLNLGVKGVYYHLTKNKLKLKAEKTRPNVA